MHRVWNKIVIVASLALGMAAVGQHAAASGFSNIGWQSMMGIVQANAVVGSGTGAVTGGPSPWWSQSGRANVNPDNGIIHFEVHGLVLAVGNSIGTPGPVLKVKGTLVCDTDGSATGGNSVLVDTPLVDLDDQGNARFNGALGPLPAACVSEPDIAFLVRTSAGRWIANGTVLE